VNLIENSVKYTSHGGNIWVKLSVDGSEAVVRVADTGIGISSEMMPRIFDLFTQTAFETRGSGLGIGVSMVKDLARCTAQSKSAAMDLARGACSPCGCRWQDLTVLVRTNEAG
jgi:K+-sensing histidine kinase KdpD